MNELNDRQINAGLIINMINEIVCFLLTVSLSIFFGVKILDFFKYGWSSILLNILLCGTIMGTLHIILRPIIRYICWPVKNIITAVVINFLHK